MIDAFGLPPQLKNNTQIFLPNGNVLNAGMQTWIKPKGISMVHIFLLGAGAGGGGGFTRAAGNPGGGGGGGGAGGVARLLIPAFLLPDSLMVVVGVGGNGGAASSAGQAPQVRSEIFFNPTSTSGINQLLFSCNNLASGGGAGTAGAGGAAGGHATVGGGSVHVFYGILATNIPTAGPGAGGAQTGAVGAAVTTWAASALMHGGGAGGAGCTGSTNFDGGGQTASVVTNLGMGGLFGTGTGGIVPGGTGTGSAINGSAGLNRIYPFTVCGGAGGGSNNSGVGGDGGAGGYGCGGGGGGAGATGGRGGKGGDGLCIITCW